MAEPVRGEGDWLSQTRLPEPHRGTRRAALAPSPGWPFCVLSRIANASRVALSRGENDRVAHRRSVGLPREEQRPDDALASRSCQRRRRRNTPVNATSRLPSHRRWSSSTGSHCRQDLRSSAPAAAGQADLQVTVCALLDFRRPLLPLSVFRRDEGKKALRIFDHDLCDRGLFHPCIPEFG
jgi:hypothetical protein